MSTHAIINITMESVAVVVTLILLVCLRAGNDRHSRLDRILTVMVVINLCILISSIVSWIFDGNPHPRLRILVLSANFLIYLFWYILKSFLGLYLGAYIPLDRRATRQYMTVATGYCALMTLIMIISQFNGMIYTIDIQNQFHRGPLYWIAYTPILLYGLDVFIILRHQRALTSSEVRTLLSIEILPIAAALIQIFIFGILPLNTAVTISLLILYTRIQLELGKRLKQQELELQESRIGIMLSQIQPHFLYNTLTAIKNLIGKDPEQAEALVTDFSHYLRQNMDALRQKEPILFTKELEHLEIYLNIEKTRFKERLNIVYDLEITDFLLPILTVQPLVENAVRHGVTKKREGGTVTIETRRVPEGVQIVVRDDGAGFDPQSPNPDRRSHVGLENVRQRLIAQCGGSLSLESAPGAGTAATILLPDKRRV